MRTYAVYRIVILLLFALLGGCASRSEFLKTGNPAPALDPNAEVKVVAWGDPGKYDQIGIVDIGQYSLEERIEEAKKVARQNGGDVIMPKGVKDLANTEDIKKEGYMIQSFLVLKTRQDGDDKKEPVVKEEPASKNEEKIPDKTITVKSAKKSGFDHKNLPRATYKLLIEDYKSLKGEYFKGALYPIKIYGIPRALKNRANRTSKFLQMSTRSGRYKLYVLVPKKEASRIKKLIRAKKKMEFVYTPANIYVKNRVKYPVLQYIEDIKK